jgi:AAA domain
VINVEIRFPRTSLREAYERSKQSERWVFPETVCSSVTLIYGRSNVGKSYLVASMLLSLLIEGREFLGMQPTDSAKLRKPAILWTDPGSDEEYADRICQHLPEGVEVEIPMFHVGKTITANEWETLTESLIAEGFNCVVLDNLMGVTEDTNNPDAVTTVFDGMTRLTNRGIPVVVIHHESEHGASNTGGVPMGASVIVQKARTWIQVRQTAKRKLRGGNMVLVIHSNGLQQPQQLIAEPMTGPTYRVLNRGPWATEDKPKSDDENARVAAWIIDNCQGSGVNKVADELAIQFPSRKVSTWRLQLMRGELGTLLIRDGEGDNTSWRAAA